MANPVLSIRIDPTQATQGASKVSEALAKVKADAIATERTVEGSGKGMGAGLKKGADGADALQREMDRLRRTSPNLAQEFDRLEREAGGLRQEMARLEKESKGVEAGFIASAKGMAGWAKGAAAAVAGGVAFATQAGLAAIEAQNLARAAGVSMQEMQVLGFAAKSVGFEMRDMSDALRDVDDRIGDYLQTGAGPLVDFFDNIAPKVGVTAANFRDLSSADALQLFVTSMERAGVSSKEMVFHMEAMSGNATFLLPLLEDGGKRLNNLVGIAGKYNQANDETVSISRELKTSFGEVGLSLNSAGVSAIHFLDSIGAIGALSLMLKGFAGLIEGIADTFIFLSEKIDAAKESLRGFLGLQFASELEKALQLQSEIQRNIEKGTTTSLKDGVEMPADMRVLEGQLADVTAQIERLQKAELSLAETGDAVTKTTVRMTKAETDHVKTLREQADALRDARDAATLAGLTDRQQALHAVTIAERDLNAILGDSTATLADQITANTKYHNAVKTATEANWAFRDSLQGISDQTAQLGMTEIERAFDDVRIAREKLDTANKRGLGEEAVAQRQLELAQASLANTQAMESQNDALQSLEDQYRQLGLEDVALAADNLAIAQRELAEIDARSIVALEDRRAAQVAVAQASHAHTEAMQAEADAAREQADALQLVHDAARQSGLSGYALLTDQVAVSQRELSETLARVTASELERAQAQNDVLSSTRALADFEEARAQTLRGLDDQIRQIGMSPMAKALDDQVIAQRALTDAQDADVVSLVAVREARLAVAQSSHAVTVAQEAEADGLRKIADAMRQVDMGARAKIVDTLGIALRDLSMAQSDASTTAQELAQRQLAVSQAMKAETDAARAQEAALEGIADKMRQVGLSDYERRLDAIAIAERELAQVRQATPGDLVAIARGELDVATARQATADATEAAQKAIDGLDKQIARIGLDPFETLKLNLADAVLEAERLEKTPGALAKEMEAANKKVQLFEAQVGQSAEDTAKKIRDEWKGAFEDVFSAAEGGVDGLRDYFLDALSDFSLDMAGDTFGNLFAANNNTPKGGDPTKALGDATKSGTFQGASQGIQQGLSAVLQGFGDVKSGQAGQVAGGAMGIAGAAATGYSLTASSGSKLIGVGGGALSGAASGAALGSVVPVIGTAIGAIVGGIAGGLGGLLGDDGPSRKDMLKDFRKEQATVLEESMGDLASLQDDLLGDVTGTTTQTIRDMNDGVERYMRLFMDATGDPVSEQARELGKARDVYLKRTFDQFDDEFAESVDSIAAGLGVNGAGAKAAEAFRDGFEKIEGYLSDLETINARIASVTGQDVGGAEKLEKAQIAAKSYVLSLIEGAEPLSQAESAYQRVAGVMPAAVDALVDLGDSVESATAKVAASAETARKAIGQEFADALEAENLALRDRSYVTDLNSIVTNYGTAIDNASRHLEQGTITQAQYALVAENTALALQRVVNDNELTGDKFTQALADADSGLSQFAGQLIPFAGEIASAADQIATSREAFEASVRAQTNSALGMGYLNDLTALTDQLDTMRATARDTGASLASVDAFSVARVRQIVGGADLTADAIGGLAAQFPDLAGAIGAASRAIVLEKRREEIQRAQDTAYREEESRLKSELSDVTSRLNAAYRDQTGEMTSLIGALESSVGNLRRFRDGLKIDGNLSTLSPEDRMREAGQQFQRTAKDARGGDQEALSRLTGDASTYLDAARGFYASSEQYGAIFDSVDATLATVTTKAETEIDVARKQLAALEQQYGALVGIEETNESIAGLAEAQRALTVQLRALTGAGFSGVVGAVGGAGSAITGAVHADRAATVQAMADLRRDIGLGDAALSGVMTKGFAGVDRTFSGELDDAARTIGLGLGSMEGVFSSSNAELARMLGTTPADIATNVRPYLDAIGDDVTGSGGALKAVLAGGFGGMGGDSRSLQRLIDLGLSDLSAKTGLGTTTLSQIIRGGLSSVDGSVQLTARQVRMLNDAGLADIEGAIGTLGSVLAVKLDSSIATYGDVSDAVGISQGAIVSALDKGLYGVATAYGVESDDLGRLVSVGLAGVRGIVGMGDAELARLLNTTPRNIAENIRPALGNVTKAVDLNRLDLVSALGSGIDALGGKTQDLGALLGAGLVNVATKAGVSTSTLASVIRDGVEATRAAGRLTSGQVAALNKLGLADIEGAVKSLDNMLAAKLEKSIRAYGDVSDQVGISRGVITQALDKGLHGVAKAYGVESDDLGRFIGIGLSGVRSAVDTGDAELARLLGTTPADIAANVRPALDTLRGAVDLGNLDLVDAFGSGVDALGSKTQDLGALVSAGLVSVASKAGVSTSTLAAVIRDGVEATRQAGRLTSGQVVALNRLGLADIESAIGTLDGMLESKLDASLSRFGDIRNEVGIARSVVARALDTGLADVVEKYGVESDDLARFIGIGLSGVRSAIGLGDAELARLLGTTPANIAANVRPALEGVRKAVDTGNGDLASVFSGGIDALGADTESLGALLNVGLDNVASRAGVSSSALASVIRDGVEATRAAGLLTAGQVRALNDAGLADIEGAVKGGLAGVRGKFDPLTAQIKALDTQSWQADLLNQQVLATHEVKRNSASAIGQRNSMVGELRGLAGQIATANSTLRAIAGGLDVPGYMVGTGRGVVSGITPGASTSIAGFVHGGEHVTPAHSVNAITLPVLGEIAETGVPPITAVPVPVPVASNDNGASARAMAAMAAELARTNEKLDRLMRVTAASGEQVTAAVDRGTDATQETGEQVRRAVG